MGCTGTPVLAVAEKLVSNRAVTAGVDKRLAMNRYADHLDQLLRRGPFEEEAAGACLQRSVDVLVGVERSDHHDGDRITDAWSGEEPRGLDAINVGHSDVEQAHIESQLTRRV
jgi:hypothetical protein